MKYKYIKKNNSSKLILFFNGWGCDEKPFQFLDEPYSDVLMMYDYSSLDLDKAIIEEINDYEKVIVVAWSFGVWVAQYVSQVYGVDYHKAIAYNGTLKPVHKTEGIPEDIAQGTLNNLSEESLVKFKMRMVGARNYYKKFENSQPQREFENIHSELGALYDHFSYCTFDKLVYTKAVIGSQDMIFSAQNQQNYWDGKADVIELDAPHFCFYNYKNWGDLI